MMNFNKNYEAFATEIMRKLEDCGGIIAHAYYRECALTYPRYFLEDTVIYVTSVPDDLITVSKSELFKLILGMTHVEDDDD